MNMIEDTRRWAEHIPIDSILVFISIYLLFGPMKSNTSVSRSVTSTESKSVDLTMKKGSCSIYACNVYNVAFVVSKSLHGKIYHVLFWTIVDKTCQRFFEYAKMSLIQDRFVSDQDQ
jgi:hypothetical protein